MKDSAPLEKAFLVVDVGKTNKKVILYNTKLEILEEVKKSIDPIQDENGMEWEQIDAILDFVLSHCYQYSSKYDISSISFSAHGGTLAALDETGKEVIQVMSYTSDAPQAVIDDFDSNVISPDELYQLSRSPNLGFINLIRQIYVLEKHYPEAWSKTKTILPFNSYMAYKLSGVLSNEISFIGNHSGLWSHENKDWNSLAKSLGYAEKFPEYKKAWESCGALRKEIQEKYTLSNSIEVLVGVHDSNATYLPYLIKNKKDTVLLSTGTWCVTMGNDDNLSLSEEEAKIGAFHNINIFGEPVKTVGFTGGMEYGAWLKDLKFTIGAASESDVAKVCADQSLFIYPGRNEGSIFPGKPAGIYYKDKLYHLDQVNELVESFEKEGRLNELESALNMSLAIQASIAILGVKHDLTSMYVEGGFIKNDCFLKSVKTLLPHVCVQVSNLNEASAFGAACLCLAHENKNNPLDCHDKFEIPSRQIEAFGIETMEHYKNKFLTIIQSL